MGKGMAANLVSKGHDVVVYDVNSEAVNDLGKKDHLTIFNCKYYFSCCWSPGC